MRGPGEAGANWNRLVLDLKSPQAAATLRRVDCGSEMRHSWGIIDADGAFWRAADVGLEHKLGTDLPRDDLCDYAVRNLGYIAVQASGHIPRIRLRPAIVEPSALVALFYWLADGAYVCAAISWLDKTWSDEIVPGPANIRRRLGHLCDRSRPAARQRLLSRPLPFSALEHGTPLQIAYGNWSASKDITDLEVAAEGFDRLFNGRYTMTTPTSDGSELIIRKVGSGYKSYDTHYLRRAVGTQLEDVPDVQYGQWVAEAHRDVYSTSIPWCGEVDAIIDRPRQGAHRVRYRRLILPFSRPRGERLLVTASSLGRDIDLRVEGL